VLAGAALLGTGAALDHVLPGGGDSAVDGATASPSSVPFFGAHQAGISTPAQEFLDFAAFDLTTTSGEDLRALLKEWTAAAAALGAGKVYRPTPESPREPPADTGEALGLDPARLTITIGFGPSLFGSAGQDRFGLAIRRPGVLAPLPSFGGRALTPTARVGTFAFKPARRTLRSRSTRSTCSRGLPAAPRPCAGPSRGSAEPPASAALSRRRAT